MPPKKAEPEPVKQKQGQRQTVIIQLEKPKKRRTRRKTGAKRPERPVRVGVSALDVVRTPIVIQPLPQNPTFGQEYAQLSKMIQDIQLEQRVRSETRPYLPVNEPIPVKSTVGQKISRAASIAGQTLATIGDIAQAVEQGAGAVESGASAVGAVREAGRAVQEVRAGPSLTEEQVTMLFDQPGVSLPVSPLPQGSGPSSEPGPSSGPSRGRPSGPRGEIPSNSQMERAITQNRTLISSSGTTTSTALRKMSREDRFATLQSLGIDPFGY
jgi:hypothetical protein